MSQPDIHLACTEEFSELCALSTSGELNAQEWRRLEEHISACPQCASALAGYDGLISENIAKLAAARSEGEELTKGLHWNRERARQRFLGSLDQVAVGQRVPEPERGVSLFDCVVRAFGHFHLPRAVPLVRAAAVVILIAGIAFEFGFKRGTNRGTQIERSSLSNETSLKQQLHEAQAGRAALNEQIAREAEVVRTSEERSSRAESELKQLQTLKASLEMRAAELSTQAEQGARTVGALSTERVGLQKKLDDTQVLLQAARQELSASQDERRKILLRSASLEAENNQLSARLQEGEQAAQREQQYLASDRDIREIMGARQLYIADVFDVDPQGETKKPFGRVFYTRGKSLVFYAFDLEQQNGYREAKAFQAWGRAGSSKATPVSLGIFYMDNESNRRWALKFDNPKVLDEISAVFVTLEPQGGSKKPTNKPFLVAYLHTAPPNHP